MRNYNYNYNYIDQKLGFKNFRKFTDCPPIGLDGVTFLVGKNNSGKSTYIKGLLLIKDNYKNIFVESKDCRHPVFDFSCEDAMVGTYDRALNKNATENEIIFSFGGIEIGVSGQVGANSKTAPISFLKITEGNNVWLFDYKNQRTSITVDLALKKQIADRQLQDGKERALKAQECILKDEKEITELQEKLSETDADETITVREVDAFGELVYNDCFDLAEGVLYEHNQNLYIKTNASDFYRRKIEQLASRIKQVTELINGIDKKEQEYLFQVTKINDFIQKFGTSTPTFSIPFQKKTEEGGNIMNILADFSDYTLFDPVSVECIKTFRIGEYFHAAGIELERILPDQEFTPFQFGYSTPIYLSAHNIIHKTIYNANDPSDCVAQAIHQFSISYFPASTDAQEASEYLESFIHFWMLKFEIGTDIEINDLGNNAYQCMVQTRHGEWVHLADKGRGAIQLMTLLLQIATIFMEHGILAPDGSRIGSSVYNWSGPTLIIEEPEQNLHPALQSRLADFFCALYVQHGYQCLIETHSEYIIRRAQVLVNTHKFVQSKLYNEEATYCEFSKNPFRVYYFPQDEWSNRKEGVFDEENLPYEMVFRSDGKFSNEFGSGFLDEATNLAFEIL